MLRWLVDSEVYPEKLAARGLDYLRPSPAERVEISRIIMNELVAGSPLPTLDSTRLLARAALQRAQE